MLEEILKKANLFDVWIILIASIAIVGFWRGAWYLMDELIFPESYLLSGIITMFTGVLILVVLSKYKK